MPLAPPLVRTRFAQNIVTTCSRGAVDIILGIRWWFSVPVSVDVHTPERISRLVSFVVHVLAKQGTGVYHRILDVFYTYST